MTKEIIIQAIISGLLMGFVYALIAAGLSLIFGVITSYSIHYTKLYETSIGAPLALDLAPR